MSNLEPIDILSATYVVDESVKPAMIRGTMPYVKQGDTAVFRGKLLTAIIIQNSDHENPCGGCYLSREDAHYRYCDGSTTKPFRCPTSIILVDSEK